MDSMIKYVQIPTRFLFMSAASFPKRKYCVLIMTGVITLILAYYKHGPFQPFAVIPLAAGQA